MTGAIYAAAAGEFFGALKEIFIRLPKFDEKKKQLIEKETEKYLALESEFYKSALEFNHNSRSDELLGLADLVREQEKKLKELYKIYAKELSGSEVNK